MKGAAWCRSVVPVVLEPSSSCELPGGSFPWIAPYGWHHGKSRCSFDPSRGSRSIVCLTSEHFGPAYAAWERSREYTLEGFGSIYPLEIVTLRA